jgi:threonine/homoserine/homoserine lactone efflux protein
MDILHSILSVAAISAIGILSPGPDFIAVTHAAITKSRGQAASVAAGIILGNGIWAASALIGIGTIFTLFPSIYFVIKILGALYLCWLGIKLLKNARSPIDETSSEASNSLWTCFRKGITTTMSNPKAAIFYASALSTATSSSTGFIELSLMLVTVMTVATCWFGFVVFVLSNRKASNVFKRLKVYFESLFGIFLFAFGIRQICSK